MPSLKSKRGIFVIDDTIGVSLLLSTFYLNEKNNILILASNLYNAQRIANIISSFVGSENVILFPADELFRAENIASSKELVSERLFALSEIQNKKKKIVIAHPSSVLRYLPSPDLFRELTIKIKVGDKLNISSLISKLTKGGYLKVNKIDKSLEFAKRGDIIDISSINYDNPIRISLFDDEVESISFFDISNQTSIEKIDSINIIPANDILFLETEQIRIREKLLEQLEKDKLTLNTNEAEFLDNTIHETLEKLNNYSCSETLYKLYSFLQEHHYSLLDYFSPDIVFFCNYDQFISSYDLLNTESKNYLDELRLKGHCISKTSMFQDLNIILDKDFNFIKGKRFREKENDYEFSLRPVILEGILSKDINTTITSYLKNRNKIIIALSNISQTESIKNNLNENNIKYEEVDGLKIPDCDVSICLYSLCEGFELVDEKIVVLTDKELFNIKSQSIRFSSRFKEANALKSYDDLKPGDYIVHEYNGIGKYIDVITLEVDGIHRDFLHIEYAGGDKLYVPLNQFKLIRKYSGREGFTPKLSSLNGKGWSKTKEKIQKRLDELTERLSILYKERASIPGYAFPKDDEYQEKFNQEFPYALTQDQETSYNQIKEDMEKPYPMDRLLCGDVGFGKTEVAFRAIFKCINSGKQAALLCPTTLLARQHYELAKVRFASFGLRIALFSRLVSLKDQNKYIKDIKEGLIHLIIGTHRLLSKEIEFNNLGLLVVDEEQRFGVEQKERIKEIVKNVDVLSLSATPIPRTLQMSLIGVRELSQINSAPKLRNAIQTYVTPQNDLIIKELIERELSRDGQIFYVHNNVYSIYSTASKLQKMIPNTHVGVVHGKMSREEIENVMIKFYSGEINLLVATSIIENGLDVPNANLIIVENADLFGLSQLYQIKGRVGRSDRIAYAYLLYNDKKQMNDEAKKRLKAIQEFAELGSGYKIAQRDLMIRGAGDILGKEQAGFIDSIGIDLYVKLLNDSVHKRKSSLLLESHKPNHQYSIDAYIPNDYMEKDDKVLIYQEIENCKTIAEVNAMQSKIIDIYGKFPHEVKNLLLKRKIDILTSSKEFKKVVDNGNKITIDLSHHFTDINGIGIKLFDVLYKYMEHIKVMLIKKELIIDIEKKDNWILTLVNVINEIHKLYLKEKKI